MNLVQLFVKPGQLVRFASHNGIGSQPDEDFGFTCHAWLTALFGDLAPKPFRLFRSREESARILGYSTHPAEELRARIDTFADPLAFEVLREDGIAIREMPLTWKEGNRLGFEILACPMSRKANVEKDIYLRHLEMNSKSDARNRTEIYVEWLSNQFAGSVSINSIQMTSFRRVHMTRRGIMKNGERGFSTLERPQANFDGVITVKDPDSFNSLLQRGVGRHRAFGYGMLLLKPIR